MRKLAFLFLALALSLCAAAQEDTTHPRITQGPVVEKVTPNSGQVAWSTNVSSGTVVRYGTNPEELTMRSEMPWGGYTHRVTLRQLQPDTTYFFQATSPDTQDSGEVLKSDVGQFRTPAAVGAAPAPPSGR